MGQLRGSARVFILLVVAAGVALAVAQAQLGPWPTDRTAQLVVVFLVLVGTLADIWGIHLHYKLMVTLSTASNFAATVLFGPAVSGVVGAIGSILSDVWARRAWYKVLFNSADTVLSVNAAGLTYLLLNDGSPLPLASLQNAAAIVISGVVYLLVNSAITCTVVGLAEGNNPWAVWRANFKGVYFQLITLFPLGTLIVIVYHQTPWGLALLAFPILLAHYSFESYRRLQTQSQRTMETLAQAVDRRDTYTYRHSERVALISERIARRLNFDISDTETVVAAARVHDLGKIGIESSILLKPGKLDPDEWRKMEEHPRIGADIIAQLPVYEQVRDLVAYHQERYDGKGYPYGLRGEELPMGARIIAVADAFEAMTSDRPYRKALSTEIALAELRKGRGTQFDPDIVDAFLAVMEEEAALEKGGISIEKVPSEQVVG